MNSSPIPLTCITLFRLSLQVISTCAYLIATLDQPFLHLRHAKIYWFGAANPISTKTSPNPYNSHILVSKSIEFTWLHIPSEPIEKGIPYTHRCSTLLHNFWWLLLVQLQTQLPIPSPLNLSPEPTAYFNLTNTCTSLLTNQNRLRPAPRMQTAKPNQSNPKYSASRVVIKCEEWRR